MKAAKYQNTQLELDCLWNVIFSSVDLCYISNYINWMSFTVLIHLCFVDIDTNDRCYYTRY